MKNEITAPSANANAEQTAEQTQTAPVTVLTQTELIAKAISLNVPTEAGIELLPQTAFDTYVRPLLTASIAKAESDRLGAIYGNLLEIVKQSTDLPKLHESMKADNVTAFNVHYTINEVGELIVSLQKSVGKRTATASTTTGGKWNITDGNLSFPSLSAMLHHYEPETIGKQINGAGCINKIKKCTDLNAWNVINTDDNKSEKFAVWSKANIVNAPTI